MPSTERIGNPLRSRLVAQLMFPALVIISGACGRTPQSEPASNAPANPPAASAPVATGPRVLFVQPQDGATVKSPVHFEFGLENYAISPVPKPAPEKPREGVGHHHLGVDTDCLPVGEVIPAAQPWIHFGDGRTVIEMQLTPGPHKFALQLGDDQHRTLNGLCSTISVTVAQ